MREVLDTTRIRQKRGTGRLSAYVPWFSIHEISSKGVSWRIRGIKTKRIHHLLSTLEKKVMLYFDNVPSVIDIREQFPLPLQETLRIASSFGIKHGGDKSGYRTMTTDFLIDYPDKQIAISVKPLSEMTPRTVAKFLIEQEYWSRQGIRYWVLNENEIDELIQNGNRS